MGLILQNDTVAVAAITCKLMRMSRLYDDDLVSVVVCQNHFRQTCAPTKR